MTNERWRAEMPTLEDWEFFDAVREGFGEELESLVTRANAELDAAEAREAALTKERDELKEFRLKVSQAVGIVYQADGRADEPGPDSAVLGETERIKREAARVFELESELAARRASDEDVSTVAYSIVAWGAPGFDRDAAKRLVAADWLKKEGES